MLLMIINTCYNKVLLYCVFCFQMNPQLGFSLQLTNFICIKLPKVQSQFSQSILNYATVGSLMCQKMKKNGGKQQIFRHQCCLFCWKIEEMKQSSPILPHIIFSKILPENTRKRSLKSNFHIFLDSFIFEHIKRAQCQLNKIQS